MNTIYCSGTGFLIVYKKKTSYFARKHFVQKILWNYDEISTKLAADDDFWAKCLTFDAVLWAEVIKIFGLWHTGS